MTHRDKWCSSSKAMHVSQSVFVSVCVCVPYRLHMDWCIPFSTYVQRFYKPVAREDGAQCDVVDFTKNGVRSRRTALIAHVYLCNRIHRHFLLELSLLSSKNNITTNK